MGSYQIWPFHVTQAENLSFPYLKSYCPLNFRKIHQKAYNRIATDLENPEKSGNLRETSESQGIWNTIPKVKEFFV